VTILPCDKGVRVSLTYSDGNVGIGTQSPSFGLQIDGSNFSGDSLKITRGTSEFYVLNANNSYGVLGMSSNHDLQIRTDGTTRMTIDNDGKVGIGITPSTNLDVAGSGGSDGAAGSPTIRLSNTVASSDWDAGDVVGTIEYYAHDTSGNAPYVTSFIKSVNPQGNGTLPGGYLSFGTCPYNQSGGATEEFRMETDGDFHAKQDVVAYSTTPSDRRLKKNIKEIHYGLDTIMSLNPKEYDWKENDRHDIGFIAQEVEEVIPEIVKDKKHFDKEIKTLDYEKLTAVLIKAVQEQQEQINELKEQLNG